MEIRIYGKDGCGLCEAAKEKMKRLGTAFRYYDLEDFDEEWKGTGKVEAMAWHSSEETLPIFRVDGDFMLYPQAMKLIKQRKKNERALAAANGA